MLEFDAQRKQEEEARRARAAARDAERRAALAAGARAPSRADGSDATGVLRAATIGAGVIAAASLLFGLVTLWSPLAAVGLAGAAVFGAGSFALHRLNSKQAVTASAADRRLASLAAGTLTSAPDHEQAWRRARSAVEAAPDLDPKRRTAILGALDVARDAVRTGADPERTARFIGRCDEIVDSLASLPAPQEAPPTAFDQLDAVTADLGEEANARAEIEEALRTARGATARQTEG